jgi:hypothetical protein
MFLIRYDGRPSISGNNYTFKERSAQLIFRGNGSCPKKLEAPGVRVENTNQNYNTQLSKDVNAKSGNIKYTDFLPCLQFKICAA